MRSLHATPSVDFAKSLFVARIQRQNFPLLFLPPLAGGEPAPDSIRGAEGGWGERGNAALLLMFRVFQGRPFQPQLTPCRRSPFGPALPFASASCLCNPFSRNEETCS